MQKPGDRRTIGCWSWSCPGCRAIREILHPAQPPPAHRRPLCGGIGRMFAMAERVPEVHVKAPHARPISDEAAALAGSSCRLADVPVATALARSGSLGGRLNSASDNGGEPAVDNFDAVIASHGSGLLARVGLPSVNHPTSRSKVKLIRRLAALGRPSIAHVPEVETSQCINARPSTPRDDTLHSPPRNAAVSVFPLPLRIAKRNVPSAIRSYSE